MPKVLFIVPPVESIYEKPPVGTLLLATILQNGGISSDILPVPQMSEFSDFNTFIDMTVSTILEKKVKIVSFYTRCDVYHVMLKIAERLKLQSEVTIVFGGPQADIVAQETLMSFPYVDYICQGEGETTVVPFFSSLLQGTPDLSVLGLVYRNQGHVIQNPRPALLHDLDALPEIDYSIIGMTGSHANIQRFPIDVGRGCPFGCSYCSTNTFWGRKFRLKSPERICAEVESLHEKYGISSFSFSHDMFTLDRKQVVSVCQLLKGFPFSIDWSCSARIDCIDNDLVDCMVDAGMNRIFIGIESGSERVQKLIHKNLKLDLVLPRLEYICAKGIHITVSFIFGFPEETQEDLSKTISLIREIAKLDNVEIQTHLCTFLPGTELSMRYASKMVPARYLSDITGSAGVRECESMIRTYPEVFPQFQEYNTELRTRLEHFFLFVRIWLAVQPVYQLFSEKYEKDQLINMYYDFVECNSAALAKCNTLPPKEQRLYLLENDMLAQKLAPEDMREIIRDCYRMAAAHYSIPEITNRKVDAFCFSPKEFKRGTSVMDYRKQATVVVYQRQDNGQIKMYLKSL